MITTSLLNGHKAVWLENDLLRLVVLPDKGADIPLIYHQPSRVQFLMQTPSGLQPTFEQPTGRFFGKLRRRLAGAFPQCKRSL